MLKFAAFLVILASTPVDVWAINKCVTPDGKITYQDAPCDADKKRKSVNLSGAGQPAPTAASSEDWKERYAALQRRERAEEAIRRGEIFIGMTATEAQASWGDPSKINSSLGSYGKHEQWVYDLGNYKSQYVYIENGVVRGVQSSE